MPTDINEKPYERNNISGGVQNQTTKFLKNNSEVDKAVNASFARIGGVEKIKGMSRVGNIMTTSTSTSTSSSTSTSTSSSSTTTA